MPSDNKETVKERVHYARAVRTALIQGKELKALEESGLVEERAINTLQRIKTAKPESYSKDSIYIKIVENQSSKAISRAMRDGNIDTLAHAVGGSVEASKSSYRKIEEFKSYINTEGKVYIIDGEPNDGKTNTALLIAEFWKEMTDGRVASNMKTCESLNEVVQSYNELEEFLDSEGEVLFIFDDASNHASGYDKDREAMETKMRKLSNFIAKKQGVLIFIGHTGKDIHPDTRRKARKIEKNSIKSLTVYDDVRKDGTGVNERMTINGVPKARWSYDPYEETKWDWNIEDDVEEEIDIEKEVIGEIKSLASNGEPKIRTTDISASNTKVAEVFRDINRGAVEIEELNSYRYFGGDTPKQWKKRRI